ncbi:MAG: LuxR C-terminal-related transcriptional regulator [Clostridiales Family XIII bacterium]|jgi:LuxR family maltose regulon positive regulatory protein|nr:LuxR C-terminal-related transcriptional regulator [Clostridiales Family XIII bacterium]
MSRPRIDTLLSEAMEKSVALIHGGEGCGKSCAVGSYLMGVDANVWWVQLSEADNHPSRLWETICSAIAQVNRENASALATMGFPGVGERYKMCYDIVLDMLKPNESYVLVFDDVHLISDPDVIAFLLNLVHSPLPDVSHIFISREETISVYDVGTSDEDVMIIDERDLLFTKVEVGDYLAMIEVNAVPSLVDEVYNASEGLAYLINFAGRLVKKRPDSAKRIRDVINRNMSKSIDDRFFEDLPDEMKKFYAKLSLLDHLSHAMIESLPVGAGLISEAMKRTSMIRYDAYTSSYHIHHMFLEYLWGKPDLLTEEERVETYRAAAQWCSGNGYRLEAIGYYEKIGDYNAVVDVARSMNPHIDFRAGAYLLGIFERAGPDVFDKNPHARVLYTRILLALGRIDEGIEKCGQFIADLEARKLAGENAVVLIWLYCNLGFAKIFKATDSGEYGFSEHFKKADEYMKEAGIEDSIGTVNAQIMPYSCLVGNNRKGDPEKLVAELSRSIPYSSRILGGCMYGSDDLTMSEIAYYRGDMTACERYAIQCCMKAREAGQSYAEGRALFLLLRMNLCRGRYSKIGEVLEQYDELVKRADSYVEYLQQEIVFSWYYASIGEIDNVVPWIKSDFVSPDSEAYFMGLEDIAKMKYYFVEKKYHVSLAFLDSRPRSYGVRKYMIGQIGMAVSEAICLYNHKDRDGAIDALRRGYELSAPNAFDMPFIEMGNNMRSLAGAALRGEDCGIPTEWLDTIRSKSATYAKRVAHVKSKYRQDVGKNSDVPLTLKEKEILRDMSQGLSRTEIATYRGVSVNTVKAMLQVVYEKLGADNSMDALRIAISKEIV